jgi:hypothetical protein
MMAAIPLLASVTFAASGGVNTTVITPSLCLNGSQVNCNNYGSKADVYLSGNPSQLTAGTYFYAVVDPGGQPNPNDTGAKNLSIACDTYTNREFTVNSSGQIAPVQPTTHHYQTVKIKGGGGFTNTFIQVGDPTNGCYFANTANPGGVYILAACLINPATYNPSTNPVDPKSCKYDAFKVKQTSTTLSFVLSGYKFLDPDLDAAVDGDANEPGLQGWTITVSNNLNSSVLTAVTGSTGYWTVSGDLPVGATSETLTICEVLQSGWQQTGPLNTNSVTPLGAASLLATSTSPTGNCYQVKVSSTANSAVAGLDFFNTETSAPFCALTASGIDNSGQAYIQVTVQDSQSGLKSVQVTELVNATAAWDSSYPLSLNGFAPLTPGDTSAHIVTATKIDQTQGANLGLEVIDRAGNVTDCDPVQMAAIRSTGRPVSQQVAGVRQTDHLLHIFNGAPGVASLTITINGKTFKFNNLSAGQHVTLDVASALQAGTNAVTLTTTGRPGGSTSVLFGNI